MDIVKKQSIVYNKIEESILLSKYYNKIEEPILLSKYYNKIEESILLSKYYNEIVLFPIPKLYMVQTGLEASAEKLPGQVQYDIRLSDSYRYAGKEYGENAVSPDLDVTVHVYDFRMTLDETVRYIEQNVFPNRFGEYDNDLRSYVLTANGITYMQRAVKDRKHKKYVMPANVSNVAEYLKLLVERDIFVELLTDKEVCDMTTAQFSRDDILIYQGREEGRAEGKAEDIMEFLEDIGEPSDALEQLIMGQTDIEVLRRWLKAAARAESIEEFERVVGLAKSQN